MRDDAAPRAEQMQDVEVLLGLRHHAVVGGDDQQHEVDAVRAGEHVADEALVPGHVDDAGRLAVADVEVREAEVDRDAALALLLEPVGVDPGQRFDQRRLAVIDVAGGAEDHVHVGPQMDTDLDGHRRPSVFIALGNQIGARATTQRRSSKKLIVVHAADDRRLAGAEARGDGVRRHGAGA